MSSSDYPFRLQSHPGKLLVTHLTQVLANGDTYLARRNLPQPLHHALRLALVLHDLGKATPFFQGYLAAAAAGNGDAAQAELGYLKNHARLSALWAWRFACDQWHDTHPLPWLIYHAVLKHHGHLGNLKELVLHPPHLDPRPFSHDGKRHQLENLGDRLMLMSAHLDYTEFAAILRANGITVDRFDHHHFGALCELFHGRKRRPRGKKWAGVAAAIQQANQQQPLHLFFEQSLIFSVLLTCDKGECIFDGPIYHADNPKFPADLIDRYKAIAFAGAAGRLNQLREQVYREVGAAVDTVDLNQQRFYSINLPTGMGKTLCVLNAAVRLLQREPSLRKIVYCLPFTSVIDQLGGIARDILTKLDLPDHSANLALLHHLAELHYRDASDDHEFDNYQGEFLIQQLEANLTLTTFYQLLHGILTHRNRDIRKFSALADSVIILDEVQSIPVTYWALVRQVFTLVAERLNCVFVLVTATMPMIFEAAEGQIQELVSDPRAVYQALNRITLDCALLKKPFALSQDEGGLVPVAGDREFCDFLAAEIAQHAAAGILVIVNTRAVARVIYREIKARFPERELVFLSGDVTPHDRLARITAVKKAAGANLVIISTQLVEAGVDIDLGRVYRQRAPLDAVFQAAGRCNRNNGNQGRVILFRLRGQTPTGTTRDLGEIIYGDVAMQATQQVLATHKSLQESAFFDCAQTYFATVKAGVSNKETRDLCDALKCLDYAAAFRDGKRRDHNQPIQPFRLIEEQDTQSFLVLQNDEARRRYAEYQALSDSDGNKHDIAMQHKIILRALAPYTLSVYRRRNASDATQTFFDIVYPAEADAVGATDYVYDAELGLVIQHDACF
ncbi:CRISPR-associated helicase Cas3' [Acanthopleuribacter pedis]|uniref:CRISPR-associated helicase Cas3 n=1 Tax=Acanthopleuribacter pedis TaxID=442870 RepID=A0A8J7U383_9BACT|nr:CRISPR-associated helicase Cas3' [Acanthopleuribacter pedis]MBO1318509.1 CRISPR-associated helicase Cas3' [Acanthopleuribacter pedis]